MPQLLYQRLLEIDSPPNLPPNTIPIGSWPLPLSDGSTLLTLLYGPLATRILHINPNGDAQPWQPAAGYPAPVLFHANPQDHLVGFDLTNLKKIYACTPSGQHLWSLEISLRLDNLLCPTSFHQDQNTLHWITAENIHMSADLSTGTPTHIYPSITPPPNTLVEIHHPHTHLLKNSLYILDFDPLPRITRYQI